MIQNVMRDVMNSRLFNLILLFTIIGEFFLPWVLKRYYNGYDSKTMVMSALGSPQSPVRLIYNMWLIWLGVFLIFVAAVYYFSIRTDFPILSVLLFFLIGFFAIGAGVISGIFSVNETKEIISAASKIHGASAAIGFMVLLFFPLLNGILSFRKNCIIFGVIDVGSFILALIFFALFIMGDKEQFQNSIIKYEGLWERLTLFCMYIPFIHKAVYRLFI